VGRVKGAFEGVGMGAFEDTAEEVGNVAEGSDGIETVEWRVFC